MGAVEGNGNVIRLRLDRLEIGHDKLKERQERIDDRQDEKDKRDVRIEDRIETLITAFENSEKRWAKFTTWLQITAGTIFTGTVVAIVTVAMNQ